MRLKKSKTGGLTILLCILGIGFLGPQSFLPGKVFASAQQNDTSDVPKKTPKAKSSTLLTPKLIAKLGGDILSSATRPTGAATCPTINGALGSGSPDWPSTTQTQTARLFRDGIASTCAAPKACPGAFSSGTFTTDAYTFSNQTGSSQCVTVNFDPNAGGGLCGTNVHAIAYLGSYDPNNFCNNYLADVGSSVTQPFSFTVPNGSSFVVVIGANNSGVGVGCTYQFTVVGNFCSGGGGGVTYTNCFVDSFSGDTFSIDADPLSDNFGSWLYHVAGSGMNITGNAETITYNRGRLVTASDLDTPVKMMATVNILKKTATVTVLDKPNFMTHTLSDGDISKDPPCTN